MKPNVPSAFLRQFHKGNFAKIYMVKWSQSWMYVAISMNSGVSKNKNSLLAYIFIILRYHWKKVSVNKNQRPLNKIYFFFHVTIINKSWICKKYHQFVFKNIFVDSFAIEFSRVL